MKQLYKTLLVTSSVSLFIIIVAVFVQLNGAKVIVLQCSYLDPWIIDALAFLAAVFLIIEGYARIFEHPTASLSRQSTRIIRVAFGFAILTLHIIQVMHK
ncbi:hypothetical protein J4422_03345 [Candidatus Pacearchaeota archaeon]|nr:hypothetical protein [Candidatus Pacearchaeota archaeon]